MELRKIPIHHSLIRPILLGGAERRLAYLNGTVAAALMVGTGGWFRLSGLVLGIVGQAILVRLAKVDTQFFDVYLRHIQYKDVYSARPLHGAPIPRVRYWLESKK